MALTFVFQPDDFEHVGKFKRTVYKVTGDASYVAGGYPVSAEQVGSNNIRAMRVLGCNAVAAELLVAWDFINNKILVLYPTGGGLASPAALGDPLVQVVVPAGATPVTSDAAQPNLFESLTPGRGKEVLAGTDLTTCMWLLEFIVT